ncbi:hypothetical protein K1719_030176 [Acacia pycnantha]|nr:hypothetical protein K1719_030176 [Acacia pycnantha]
MPTRRRKMMLLLSTSNEDLLKAIIIILHNLWKKRSNIVHKGKKIAISTGNCTKDLLNSDIAYAGKIF